MRETIYKIDSLEGEKKVLKILETEYQQTLSPRLSARRRLNNTLAAISKGNGFAKSFLESWLKCNGLLKAGRGVWIDEYCKPKNFCGALDGYLRTPEDFIPCKKQKTGGKDGK